MVNIFEDERRGDYKGEECEGLRRELSETSTEGHGKGRGVGSVGDH